MSELLSLDIENKDLAKISSSETGKKGEQIAAEFLEKNSYRLVAANFTVPIGRNRRGAVVTGEIDLIGFNDNALCFVEVKTRSSDLFASPLAAVDLRKQRQIIRAARMYRKIFRLNNITIRYDVVSIILNKTAAPKIDLYKSFWNESKFSKKFWIDDN